jgi:hypothetical protein
VPPQSSTNAAIAAARRCTPDKVADLALASRSEIRIICTSLPPEYASPVTVPRRLPHSIGRILSADQELQPLFSKASDLRALAGLVDGFFPPDLARQVRVANFREGELVLAAANPPAAAKIKLLAPSLSRFLEKQRWQVNSVSVRVQPNASQGANSLPPLEKSAKLSTSGLAALRALYEGLSDSPARQALAELLAHHDVTGPGDTPRKGSGGKPPLRKAR